MQDASIVSELLFAARLSLRLDDEQEHEQGEREREDKVDPSLGREWIEQQHLDKDPNSAEKSQVTTSEGGLKRPPSQQNDALLDQGANPILTLLVKLRPRPQGPDKSR